MKRLLAIVVVAAALVAWTGAGQGQEIKIGLVAMITGPFSFDGLMTVYAARVAVKQINDAGGILGHPIKLIEEDSRGIPAEALNAIKKLVHQDQVHALECCWFSSSTFAAIPEIEKVGVPTVTAISTAASLTRRGYKWLFRASHHSDIEAPGFVEFWVKDLKVKRVAFLARNDDWGRETIKAYKENLLKLGGTVLAEEFAKPGESDYTSYLTKIKATSPEAIDMVEVTRPGAAMVKQIRDLGMKVMLLGSDGQVTDKFIELAEGAAEGMYVLTRWEPAVDNARSRKFVEDWKKMRPGADLPDEYAQAGYDDIYVLAEAIKRAADGSPERLRALMRDLQGFRTAVRDALKKTDYIALSGARIQFDANNQAYPHMYIVQIKGGKRQIVKKFDTRPR